MKKWTKQVAAVLGAIGIVFSLTACGDDESRTRVVFTTGFSKDEVFRIGSISCKKEELMVYLTNTQNQYESVYGEEIWNTTLVDTTLEENVKEIVLARIAQIKTMYLLAEEKGITLDEAESERVSQAAEEYFSSLDEQEIALMGITYDTIRELYEEYALADKVYYDIIQDINPEISDDEARTITVQHILLRTVKQDSLGNTISYSEEDKQMVYRKAKEIWQMAVDGASDFTELATMYSEDEVITYSFGKGEMDKVFEDAAFQLETDEVSGVVETDVGYHIIKCLNTFNREETDANKLQIVEQRRNEVFGEEYDAFVDSLVRQLNQKVWDQITLIHDPLVDTSDFFHVFEQYFPK